LGRARVDPDYFGAPLDDPRRQDPVSTAEIEDPFTRQRGEQLENRIPEIGDESGVAAVFGRIPRLTHDKK
jgi:hypothetical protein